MELRDQEYKQQGIRSSRQQIWVSYGAISEHLKKAVLVSEDATFFSHTGIDSKELQEALKKTAKAAAQEAAARSRCTGKNLYLIPSKNPCGKLRRLSSLQLKQALSKRRIFEIYLNVVEWGRDVYGAEAASRHYFAKPAANLDIREAATLAALLPNPRNPREKNLIYRRNLILSRMAEVGYVGGEEFNRAKQAPLFKKIGQDFPLPPRED